MSLHHVGIEVEEEDHQEWVHEYGAYYDDMSGTILDPTLASAARDEEIQEIMRRNIYTVVPISECWKVTGKKPIGVRFVDVTEIDNEHPNYRSRLVAKEFRENGNAWFAGTPPWEAMRILFSLGASRRDKRRLAFI